MLVDLKGLCARPLPGESGGCMSSFDRASAYDPETDTYACWDANDDGSGCIRRLDDGSIVAFECEGPGVIWRTWSALPRQGHIRVFFDGEAQPQIDMPFADWFEAQPGEIPPLNLSELSLRLSRGRNSFIPIPFQKSCRIELAESWGAYYHFTYTRFPEGTALPAYGERFSRDGMIALAETDRLLYDRGEAFHPDMVIREAGIGPEESAALFEASGSGAIREMVFFPDLPLTNEASRSLILKVWWDGSERTAVEAPVGDFFGGPGYGRYRCLPMSMERDRSATHGKRLSSPPKAGGTESGTEGMSTGGGERATRNSSLTEKSSPPHSAPEARIISAMPGRQNRPSPALTAPMPR